MTADPNCPDCRGTGRIMLFGSSEPCRRCSAIAITDKSICLIYGFGRPWSFDEIEAMWQQLVKKTPPADSPAGSEPVASPPGGGVD